MMRAILLTLILLPSLALARVEMFQIVTFNWDEDRQALQLMSLGSGTAVASNLVLTNRHVVKTGENEFADFLLLCQAQEKAGESVVCNIPAGVAAAHPDEDVALVKPIAQTFFPQVRLSHQAKRAGDPVRVLGFPTPNTTDNKLGFGDTKTLAGFQAWMDNPSGPLEVKGDKLTVTRGQVQHRLQNQETGFTYTLTDAKVNFGNSGGAAFDEYGDYLGIVTYKDQDGNSIFLEYYQINDWVKTYQDRTPNYEVGAYNFFKSTQGKTTRTTTTRTQSRRGTSLRERLLRLRQIQSAGQTSSTATSTTDSHLKLIEYLRQKRAQRQAAQNRD